MLVITCLRQSCTAALSLSSALGQCRSSVHFRCFPKRTFFKKSTGVSKLQPPAEIPFDTGSAGFSSLLKPFVFTICNLTYFDGDSVVGNSNKASKVVFSGGVFACAALWQYEDMRKKARSFSRLNSWFELPYGSSRNKQSYGRGQLSALWNRQTEGQKVASVIAALNCVVFLMWRVPGLTPFMCRYFLSTPALNKSCWPMFLSTFSHFSFFHMATNMVVLYSFSTSSVLFFGKEQFVALYCSAGVVSSFTSYLYKVVTKSYGPSVGASGALLGIISSSCIQFPHARLALIFLPFFTISAGNALKAIMALDFVGMIARWQFFDHAAHFGGAVYGILYLWYGQQHIWAQREPLVNWWHKLRGKPK